MGRMSRPTQELSDLGAPGIYFCFLQSTSCWRLRARTSSMNWGGWQLGWESAALSRDCSTTLRRASWGGSGICFGCPLDRSLRRCSRCGGGPEKEPVHAGASMLLRWPGNSWGFYWRSLGAFVPAQEQKKMDAWMEGWIIQVKKVRTSFFVLLLFAVLLWMGSFFKGHLTCMHACICPGCSNI